jgi:signal transduction histidine kinase
MQEMPLKHHRHPLVLAQMRSRSALRLHGVASQHRKQNPFLAYFLSISFISLLVRFFRLTRHILSFIITGMNNKKISRQQELAAPQIVAVEEEKHLQPYIYSNEHETELKDHFLTMASHELKTPMTTIIGQAQLVLRRLSKLPELPAELVSMRSALESIDGQARRLNVLVDDLLNLYNIRSGKITLRLSHCDLVDLCRKVVEEQCQLTGRSIEIAIPIPSIQMYADVDRLHQVVVNLVSNALRYSSEDNLVKITALQHLDIGIIEVQDHGVGIPREQQTHIFEPFYRGPEEQVSAKSGLGLGLAICKDIVERHHGRIWCRSRVGKGSTFIVELPMNKKLTQALS